MVSDASPEVLNTAAASGMLTDSTGQQVSVADLTPVNDDPTAYTYNDEYDAGRMSNANGRHQGSSGQQQPGSNPDYYLLADLNLDDTSGQTQSMGIFNN